MAWFQEFVAALISSEAYWFVAKLGGDSEAVRFWQSSIQIHVVEADDYNAWSLYTKQRGLLSVKYQSTCQLRLPWCLQAAVKTQNCSLNMMTSN